MINSSITMKDRITREDLFVPCEYTRKCDFFEKCAGLSYYSRGVAFCHKAPSPKSRIRELCNRTHTQSVRHTLIRIKQDPHLIHDGDLHRVKGQG